MGKFIVINTAGVFILGLLFAGGFLAGLLHSSVVFAVAGLLVLVMAGLACVAFKKLNWARWITNRMTGFGLAGTVLGVITAFTNASFVGDPITVMASLSTGIGLALYSTLTGIIGWLWLDWNLAHQGDFSE